MGKRAAKSHDLGIPAELTFRQGQVEALTEEIDGLVYELYGLTKEQVALIEGPQEA